MRRNDRVSWFAITLAISLVLGSIMPIVSFADTYSPVTDRSPLHRREYVRIVAAQHDPIAIDGDANFSITAFLEGWPGDGSFENPYIIDSLDIDRGGLAGHCISISNTRANFTIRNCNFTRASANAGLFLNNVSHGSLINNTCTLNRYGIQLVDSHYNTITNNTCSANGDGINARSAVSNTFGNNSCNGNSWSGFQIWDRSCGNLVSQNICNGNGLNGIVIHNDDSLWLYAFVTDNTCSNSENGIWAGGSYINIVNNTVTDNEIRGIYGEFSEGTIADNTIKRSYEGIALSHGRYITLSKNSIAEGDWGIWLQESSENMISQNSITEFVQYGIFVEMNSDSNTILLNEIAVVPFSDYMEFVGICLTGSTGDHNVTLNHILFDPWHSSDHHAMRDDSPWNNLIDRNWYEEYGGVDDNDDGYGDTPYDIFGSAGNQDLRPLMYPPFAPTWVELPTDQVIDYWSQPFYYDINATAPTAMTWTVNDTVQFSIDNNGFLQSITDLPVGLYGLSVKVTNYYGIYITTSFVLTVQEISPPEWISGPMDLVIKHGEGFYYGLIAMDQSGISDWTINDTGNFMLSVTWLNVTGYPNGWHLLHIANTTSLLAGMYPLNVTVVDPYGNALMGIFIVTVESPDEDVTDPIWIVSPMDEILEYGEPFEQRLGAWDLSGIDHWWLNDTTQFAIDETGVVRNVTVVEPGVYRLEVRAYDPSDNYCSAALVLIVVEAIDYPTTTTFTTPTTQSPTDTASPTSPPPPEIMGPVSTIVLVAGISGAAVVITIIVLLRSEAPNG